MQRVSRYSAVTNLVKITKMSNTSLCDAADDIIHIRKILLICNTVLF